MSQALDLIDVSYNQVCLSYFSYLYILRVDFAQGSLLFCIVVSGVWWGANCQSVLLKNAQLSHAPIWVPSFLEWLWISPSWFMFLQVGPDMLICGFLQPIPDLTPVIPSSDETSAIDPTISPYEPNIIFFYKTWDHYGAFSNFSPHPIQMPDNNGNYGTWSSVEHFYQVMHVFWPLLIII